MGMDIVFTMEMVEVVGIALGVVGVILTIVICALPTWIETTFIAANAANTEVVLHGLWMCCVTKGTGQTQCEVYNSMGYIEHILQPARVMIPTAIILGVPGVMASIVGSKHTNCVKDETSQAKLRVIAGILFILAGILILIPLSLVTRFAQIYGASLNFCWVASSLLLIGGFILCINVGVFGWMMGIFGWIVSLGPCYISIFCLDKYARVPSYRDIWMDLMMITSISTILGALGVMGSIFGTRCCNCIKSNRIRVMTRLIVGIFFILDGILQLTNVFLSYNSTHNFPEHMWEVLLFFAELSRWAASMLLIGGTILCCSTLKRKKPDSTITKSPSH